MCRAYPTIGEGCRAADQSGTKQASANDGSGPRAEDDVELQRHPIVDHKPARRER
jgi:hypothetical protein